LVAPGCGSFGNPNMIRAATVEDAKALAVLNDAVWRTHAEAFPLVFNPPADPSMMTSWFAGILGRAQRERPGILPPLWIRGYVATNGNGFAE
jgi:hypothetical protein